MSKRLNKILEYFKDDNSKQEICRFLELKKLSKNNLIITIIKLEEQIEYLNDEIYNLNEQIELID